MQEDIIQTEVTEESAALEENFFDDAWDEDTAPVEEETEDPEANQQPEVNEQQSEAAEAEEHSENTADNTAPTHAEEKEETFTLRYMKEDKQYSRNDTIILAQKGLDYDRVRAERDTLKSEIPTFKEYKSFLAGLKPALDIHYKNNRHHPEHFANGIKDMTLLDLLEMLCDWKASSERHADGDIYRSIEINQSRFGYSDELKTILKNTIDYLIREVNR